MKLPHPFALLALCIAFAADRTFVVPAGQYDRREDEATGRRVAVAGTYKAVESAPQGPMDAMVAVPRGMMDAASVIFFVFLVGFLGALRARGMRVIVARALGAGVLVLLCTVPWVAAAIGAVASGGGEKGALVLAAPSPLYAFVMMSEIHSYSYSTHGGTLVGGGVLATLLWLVLGVSLLGYVRARRP